MILAIYIIGAIVFVISIVAGFSSGSFIGFCVSVVGGVTSAAILFTLARIIENQENFLNRMDYKEEIEGDHTHTKRKHVLQDKIYFSKSMRMRQSRLQ